MRPRTGELPHAGRRRSGRARNREIGVQYHYTLAGAASMIPGGLGSAEATMIGLLTLNGAGSAQAMIFENRYL